MLLTEPNELVEALQFNRPDQPLAATIQIRRA